VRLSYAPCANCRSTSNGRLKYFYLNAFDGDEKLNYRLRLCPKCVDGLVADLVAICDRRDEAGTWRPPEWWG
jgi:hypothetical protein